MGKKEEISVLMSGIVDGLGEEVGVEDVIDGGLEEKFNLMKENQRRVRGVRSRMERVRSTGDVFGEFSRDAAEGKVMEMLMAGSSSDRQRAQETILDRSMGKVVDRVMSLNVEVSSLSDEELDRRIKELSYELGYAGGEGASCSILIGEEAVGGGREVKGVQGESGVSGEVCEVEGADEVSDGGE